MAKYYIGIDLGTTESTVSCITIESRRDRPIEKLEPLKIYQFDKNYRFSKEFSGLQSSIFIDRNAKRVYSGEYAKDLYSKGDKPLQTIRSVKTRIGTESLIQVPLANNTPDDVENYDMTELSAILLKTIKNSIIQQINERNIVDTTITIPAAFNSDERNATLDAAKLAGFNPHILDEPTAVLLNYLNADSLSEELDFSEPKKILVYDIGGGTLDISVANVEDNEGNFNVKILGRSPRMDFGGDDIDKYLASYFLYEFEKINPSIETRSDAEQARIISRIVSRAESAKIDFNIKIFPHLENKRRRNRIKQSVNFEVIDGLSITDLSLTDSSLKEILFDLIGKEGKLITPVKSVLTYAKLDKDDIDLIVLTGGSGKFYLIKEILDNYFSNNVDILEYTESNAVSKGAAIHSYNQKQEKLKMINLDDIMSDDIFIKKERGFDMIVPANTDPDSEGSYEYKFENISNRLDVFLYYGAEKEDHYKYKEITGVFKTLDKFFEKNESITITWKLDENKILHIYYNNEPLIDTKDISNTSSDLVDNYELNENK